MSSILIAISLLVTTFVTAFLYVRNVFSYWKRKGIPFKKPTFPFGNFANSFLQKKPISEELKELYNDTSEPFIGMYMSLQPALLVRDPKIIKDMCIKSFQNFDHRVFDTNVNADPMADNILLQKGEKWKQVRTQFSPAFSSGKLKGMFDTIVNCTNSLDEHIDHFADTGKSIEMREVFGQFATNVIASVAFGIDVDCIKSPDCEFRKYTKQFFEPSFKNITRSNVNVMMPKFANFLRFRLVDKEVGDFMIETVRQNAEYRERNNVIRKDLFQLFMQLRNTGKVNENDDWSANSNSDEKTITIKEIAAQVFLFLAGGTDSSSSSMSFTLYELAKHPEIQEKVYEEIIDTLKNHDGKITYDAIADMKYLDCCFSESLRLYPPFAVASRVCSRNYKIPDTDVIIEKGTPIYFSATGLQYDEKYYDEPQNFKPERYSDQRTNNFEELPNLVFGEGPRNCIGMRMAKLQSKLAIVMLLRKYKFELDDQHKNTEIKSDPKATALFPVNGLNFKVYKR